MQITVPEPISGKERSHKKRMPLSMCLEPFPPLRIKNYDKTSAIFWGKFNTFLAIMQSVWTYIVYEATSEQDHWATWYYMN